MFCLVTGMEQLTSKTGARRMLIRPLKLASRQLLAILGLEEVDAIGNERVVAEVGKVAVGDDARVGGDQSLGRGVHEGCVVGDVGLAAVAVTVTGRGDGGSGLGGEGAGEGHELHGRAEDDGSESAGADHFG
jgi:hypothetical protein